jgi:hypothetical protein
VLWPHTKTFVFFNKHQENAPMRIANRDSEIRNFLRAVATSFLQKPEYKLLIETCTPYREAQSSCLKLGTSLTQKDYRNFACLQAKFHRFYLPHLYQISNFPVNKNLHEIRHIFL